MLFLDLFPGLVKEVLHGMVEIGIAQSTIVDKLVDLGMQAFNVNISVMIDLGL